MDADRILESLDDAPGLEVAYRESPGAFRSALEAAFATDPGHPVLRVWHARLHPGVGRERGGGAGRAALGRALVLGLVAGLLVRVPANWLTVDWYLPRFAPSIVILSVALYFWVERRDRGRLLIGSALALGSALYVGLLPELTDSVAMALIHLPILMWAFVGFVFAGDDWRGTDPKIRFVRYNGELLILGTLVGLGGLVFSGLTVALFQMVSPGMEEWYFENIGMVGAAAVPVTATYLYDRVFRRHTGIASVLARVFAPFFLVMTTVYLVVALLGGQNPFVDRDFLITVNGLLVVVLGMAVLSVAERGEDEGAGWVDGVNLALIVVTLIIDALALAAIVFRLASYGFTPNRVVVLGANLVILVHLLWIGRAHLGLVRGRSGLGPIRRAAAEYLPVYGVWAAVVTFLLPLVFRFG